MAPKQRPRYTICRGELLWSSGAKAMIYTAESFDKLRAASLMGPGWMN
ncbi:MAG: hypothetical protein H6925_04850 [Holosporaceae bacterium]|nr:MAG: hypothetical protein H6925_04850 [Holosporaceae bacterium]